MVGRHRPKVPPHHFVEVVVACSTRRCCVPNPGTTDAKETTMGTIKSGLFISLDGVVQAPDTWQFPYFNDEMGAAVGAMMSGNDAMLIGRKTYDEFAGFWPTADPSDPITAQMNDTPKY